MEWGSAIGVHPRKMAASNCKPGGWLRLLLSVYGRKAERDGLSCPLGLSAVRACCPALCRCSISTLRFFGSSSPITLLPSILSVYLLRYVLFYSFLLFVTFLRLFDTFLFYGSISPFIPLSSPFILIPPIIPPFPFSPVFPPVSPFFPVSRGFSGLFGSFRWSWSGPGGAGSQAVTLAFGRRSGRRSCLLRLCLLSFSAVLVSSFCASFPSALVPAPALRYSGLVFFARAGRGMVRADLHKKAERRRLFGVVAPGLYFIFRLQGPG